MTESLLTCWQSTVRRDPETRAPIDGATGRRWSRTELASAAVGRSGHFSPPDRAAPGPDSELVLLGRTGRTVKIAGRRLDLAEVENALRALPGVRAAAVLAHPQRPDALAAAVAADRPGAVLRAALSARLAPWKIPARILAVAELPVTARGEIDRRAIENLLRSPTDAPPAER